MLWKLFCFPLSGEIMSKLEADPKVIGLADAAVFPNLKERRVGMVDQLERCQRALSDFLEERRSRFPRFYFIGGKDTAVSTFSSSASTGPQSFFQTTTCSRSLVRAKTRRSFRATSRSSTRAFTV